MKVLFVSSGNSKYGISPIIENQGESLKKENIELEYFTIKGKGIKGYFNAIFTLRTHLKSNNYDVVHAHYWLSAIVVSLAGSKPIVTSLMGDELVTKGWYKWILHIFYYLSWSSIIVKSKEMYQLLGLKGVNIVPNGINMSRFKPIDRMLAIEKLGWDSKKKHILFTSDPSRVQKNFKLAKDAFDFINDENLELHYLISLKIENEKMPYYYNASSVVIISSLWEGSPNAVKEAMACNIPIVATNVGDIKELISKTQGCYLTDFDYKKFALDMNKALKFKGRTTGREDLYHLKSEIIAKKIVDIYKSIKE